MFFRVHAVPFYKKRPIKFFYHKKLWSIQSFNYKNNFFVKLRDGMATEILSKRCQKRLLIKTNANQPIEMLRFTHMK